MSQVFRQVLSNAKQHPSYIILTELAEVPMISIVPNHAPRVNLLANQLIVYVALSQLHIECVNCLFGTECDSAFLRDSTHTVFQDRSHQGRSGVMVMSRE